MITREFDTIVVISTPLGEGAWGLLFKRTDSFTTHRKFLKVSDLTAASQ